MVIYLYSDKTALDIVRRNVKYMALHPELEIKNANLLPEETNDREIETNPEPYQV